MSLRKFYSEKVSVWLSHLPYGNRLNMALLALTADFQVSRALYPYFPENRYFSDEEIDYKNIDLNK